MNNNSVEVLSLKTIISGPQILDKIDLSKVDSSTRPKGLNKTQIKRSIILRDKLDSGWGWTIIQMNKNFKKLSRKL